MSRALHKHTLEFPSYFIYQFSIVPVRSKKTGDQYLTTVGSFAASQGASRDDNSVVCPYCKDDVSVVDKDHLRSNCPKINAVLSRTGLKSSRVFDPGKPENFAESLSPMATRSAAMTAISRLTGTPGCGKDV